MKDNEVPHALRLAAKDIIDCFGGHCCFKFLGITSQGAAFLYLPPDDGCYGYPQVYVMEDKEHAKNLPGGKALNLIREAYNSKTEQ